jgi:hypothetical protein
MYPCEVTSSAGVSGAIPPKRSSWFVKSGLIGLLVFVANAMTWLGGVATPGNVAMGEEISSGFLIGLRYKVMR